MAVKLLIAAAIIAVTVVLISYICFRIVFYAPRKEQPDPDVLPVPEGAEYEPYHDIMKKWIVQTRAMHHEDFYIKSFDGLTLHAKYFEVDKNAVTEIMFHGYRGSAERDLSGGVQRCFALGRNVLLVDQRTSGESEGDVISFGINEHRDCISWVDFACRHFGKDAQFVLTGISMGAATVLMAAGKPLPPNVKGVLCDCGFSSAKEIIKKCSRDMKLPADLVYPFIKLGAKLFGHFDVDEYSPVEAAKSCTLPVIFFHGESDNFVPCHMSRKLFDICNCPKRLVTIKGADHGLCYVVDNKTYFDNVTEFFTQNGVETELLDNVM